MIGSKANQSVQRPNVESLIAQYAQAFTLNVDVRNQTPANGKKREDNLYRENKNIIWIIWTRMINIRIYFELQYKI